MNEQTCTTCKVLKKTNKFPKGRKQCILCLNTYKANWYLTHRHLKNSDGSKLKHAPKHDLINKKFGKLKVIKFSGIKNQSSEVKSRLSFFLCKCDCGKEKEIAGIFLRSGNTKSCGCLIHDKLRDKHPNWTGYKGISGSCWNRIQKNSKRSSRKNRRDFEFLITKKYIWDLYQKQNGKCALSGIDIVLDVGSQTKSQTASLDRIDSNKGYIEGNVQWVHKDINSMKMDYSETYFIEMCKFVVNNKT